MHLSIRYLQNKNFPFAPIRVAFTSTYPCRGKPIHNKHIHSHLHPHEGHLHYKYLHSKKSSFALSYGCIHVCISNKDFCIRHSMNKHLHLHLHPHEGHLHNKILIRTISRLRSCLHIQ